MRIVCQTVGEFVETIQAEGVDSIFRKRIHMSRFERKRTEVCYEIVVQLSTIVDMADESGQYLLEVGESLGVDVRDASKDMSASNTYKEVLKTVRAFCVKLGLKLMPGIVDF